MPLEPICEEWKGRLLHCLPIEGFGWNTTEIIAGSDRSMSCQIPAPFQMRIKAFHHHLDDLKGGVGVIEELHHPFARQSVAFFIRDGYLRDEQDGKVFFNFETMPGKFNVKIGASEPHIQIDYRRPMPEWMVFESSPTLHGIAFITNERISLEEIYDRVSRKP